MDKYLIVGLGNPGDEYVGTRHNTGFMVLDAFAQASNTVFDDRRYGYAACVTLRGRRLTLLKPSTFMNLSGNAVRYWMNKENIALERLLVILDDLSLPLGMLRLRAAGTGGGHNGLGHIVQVLGTEHFSRLRVGIGNDFPRGMQVEHVLSRFTQEELRILTPKIDLAVDIITSFILAGVDETMNLYNKKG